MSEKLDALMADFDFLPEKMETNSGFYNHPNGSYEGFIGRPIPKYKNAEGKYCDRIDAGAQLSHIVLNLWITNYTGVDSEGKNITRNLINSVDLSVPEDIPATELYFPIRITLNPADAWRVLGTFKNWMINNNVQTSLIETLSSGKKAIVFKRLPYYYGMKCSFVIDNVKSKSGGAYIDGEVKLLAEAKYSPEMMAKLEEIIDAKFEAEKEARKAQQGGVSQYTTPVMTNFDIPTDEDPFASNDGGLGDFLGQ